MGTPAALRPVDRDVARQRAREIVDSVECDAPMPEPFAIGVAYDLRAFEIALLHMAQLIIEQDETIAEQREQMGRLEVEVPF